MSTPANAQMIDSSPGVAARTSSAFGSALFLDGAAMRVKRLDKKTKGYINGILRRSEHRAWCLRHGKTLPPPRLHPVILRVIREWFDLVDDDGSGTLEHHELLAALQAARIPCDAASISEMIKLMDANRDGCIGWGEFEAFMMDELAAGKHLLSGEYVLPSGMALPFGVMIRQLKRTQMMQEITQGGETRRKWLHYNVDLAADAKAVAEQEEAIRSQKAFNETLHNREVIQVQSDQSSDHPSSQQQQSAGGRRRASATGTASAGDPAVAAAVAAARRRSRTCGAPTSELAEANAAGMPVGIAVVAGVPLMTASATPRAAYASHQQHEHEQQSGRSTIAGVPQSLLDGMHATVTAAAAQATATATAAAAAAADVLIQAGASKDKGPPVVPRLQLSCVVDTLGHSTHSHAASITHVPLEQQGQLNSTPWCCTAVVEPGSVLASARASYWLNNGAADSQAATTAGSNSVADHLYLHKQLAAAGHSSSPSCASALMSPRSSRASGLGTATLGRCRSPRSPQHVLQPQPCRDEWGVMMASSITSQHAAQCRQGCQSVAGCKAGSAACTTLIRRAGGKACNGGADRAGVSPQQQQQQLDVTLQRAERHASLHRPAMQASPTARPSAQGGYKDACIKHLLSARATPAAALLSQDYVGPIEAAIVTARTPRQANTLCPHNNTGNSNVIAAAARTGDRSQRARTADTCCLVRRSENHAGQAEKQQQQHSQRPAAAVNPVGQAGGAARACTTPRSAWTIVATNAGSAVTLGGQVVKYLPSPRHCTSSGNGANMSSAACESSSVWPSGPAGMWSAGGMASSRDGATCTNQGSLAGSSAAAAAAAACRSSDVLHSPRHSASAKQLARAHGKHGELAAVPRQINHRQSHRDGTGTWPSSQGSSLCSSLQAGRVEQQQRAVAAAKATSVLATEISNGSVSVASDAGQQQQQHSQRHERQQAAAQSSVAGRPKAAAANKATKAANSSKHYAASGPLGGHHPAYANSYVPRPGASSCSRSQTGSSNAGMSCTDGSGLLSLSGGFGSLTGATSGAGSAVHVASTAAAASTPRLSYSGLGPSPRKL